MVDPMRLTDTNAVELAMAEFDELGREMFLRKYGFTESTGYFVVRSNRPYDSKPLLAAAFAYQYGEVLGPGDLDVGRGVAARQLERLGYEILRPPSLPDWAREELILALDLYFRLEGRISKTSEPVVKLSEELRSLPLFPTRVRAYDRFRNASGVAMKLSNFQSVDPSHEGQGMRHVSNADRSIFEEFDENREGLTALAAAIRAAGAFLTNEDTGVADEAVEGREGRLLFRMHLVRERDARLVAEKRSEVLSRTGSLACEICGFDGVKVYGEGVAVFDVHHIVPLHIAGESITRLKDLIVICPNCHRAIHQHHPFLSPEQLRAIIRNAPRGRFSPADD